MIAQQKAIFYNKYYKSFSKMSMLKNLKNKDSKKDSKKDAKNKKDVKQIQKDQQDQEHELTADLVDDSELKPQQGKQKQVVKKKNDYQLQEKEIDVSNINLNKVEKPKERTTWVANTVDEVIKKDFKMENVDHEFMSLTDQEFNQKQKQKLIEKQKQQEEKQKVAIEQNGFKFAPLQKTADQIKMQKADQQMQFRSGNTNVNTKIGESTGPAINFTNSGMAKQFAPLQKTAQQLKMEQAERKQQQELLKKPAATSWIGGKKNTTTQPQQKQVFKTSAWVTMAEQNMSSNVGQGIKFAPLNNDAPKDTKTEVKAKTETKQGGWAASNVQQQNGLKFAPLQVSKQEQRMREAQRKQQQFVFVSKKDQEERRKKREEREKAGQINPKV